MSRENFHQSLAAINVLCCIFMTGIHTNWIPPIIIKLQNGKDELKATPEQISWITSLSEMGRLFGPLLTALFLDNIGRRTTVLVCSLLFFICWSIMTFARSIALIYCLRILFGITQGVIDVTGPIYLAENCSPKMRGTMSGIIPFCHASSYIIECSLAACGSIAFVSAVNMAISFIILLTSYFLRETPYYLLMKGRPEAAKRNLQWLRDKSASNDDLKFEIDQIQQNMQSEVLKKRSLVSMFGSPENYKALLISLTFSLLITAMGRNTVVAYSSLIFQPNSIFSVNDLAIIMGIAQLISACVSPFIIERYNRRSLLLVSLCFIGICHICTFIVFSIKVRGEYFSWFIFTPITCYSVIYFLNYPVITIIQSELLPTSIRAVGCSLSVIIISTVAFINLRLFLPITNEFGIGSNFLLFFTITILLFIFVLIMLPETKGRSLVAIQMSLVSVK